VRDALVASAFVRSRQARPSRSASHFARNRRHRERARVSVGGGEDEHALLILNVIALACSDFTSSSFLQEARLA